MRASRDAVRRTATALAILAGFAAAAWVLVWSGRALPVPEPSIGALQRWSGSVGPTTVAFTLVRLVAIGLWAWFAVTWSTAVAVRLLHVPGRLRHHTDRLALPGGRRLTDIVAGATVVVATLAPTAAASATTPDATTVIVMHDLGPSSGSGSSSTTSSTTTTVVSEPPAPGPAVLGPATTVEAPPPAPESVWVIRPGDTLWFVAEQTASQRLGHPALVDDVVHELDRIVALNADRLAVPGRSDLVFPGQEFLVS